MRGKGLSSREKVLLIAGGVGLVAVLALVGGLIYALSQAGVTALRWWAGLGTAALPLAGLLAYYLGRMEARGHVAGLTQGIEAVSKAAQRTTEVAQRAADIRVSTVRQMRQRAPQAQPTVQQAFLLPGMAPFGNSAGVILPAPQEDEEVEV